MDANTIESNKNIKTNSTLSLDLRRLSKTGTTKTIWSLHLRALEGVFKTLNEKPYKRGRVQSLKSFSDKKVYLNKF